MKKKVDVIIPVHRPDGKFQKILDRLSQQTYPVSRIIVVNTDEASYPADSVREPDNMELYHVRREEFDHGGTRDMAARLSDADLMLFMTQDAVPEDTRLVEMLVGAFDEPGMAAAFARQLPVKTDSLTEQYTRAFNYPPKSRTKTSADIPKLGIKTYFCSNACAMYDREIYLSLGGFLPQSIFNEDMVYAATAIQAGYSVRYEAEARVIHSHNYSPMQQFHRNFDNGVSQAMNAGVFFGAEPAGEGLKLVKGTTSYLVKHGGILELPRFFATTVCKAAGFYLGLSYSRLPKSAVRKLSMNKEYWNQEN